MKCECVNSRKERKQKRELKWRLRTAVKRDLVYRKK